MVCDTPSYAPVGNAVRGGLAGTGTAAAQEQLVGEYGSKEADKLRDLSEAPLIFEVPKIVERTLSADPSVLYLYLANFFGSSYLSPDSPKFLKQLDAGCAKALADPANKGKLLHRLETLPIVARIHAAPFLTGNSESEAVLEPASALLRDASNPESGKANREIIEIAYLTLDALMTNRSKAPCFRAGGELLENAERICDLYLNGEETLQFGAVAAWQFLLSYEVSLKSARRPDSEKERDQVRATMKRVLSRTEPNLWWLEELSGLHKRWRAETGENLPQYEEFLLYRQESAGCYRKVREFLGLMRANMAGVSARLAQDSGKYDQSAFITPKRAQESRDILYDLCRETMRAEEHATCLLSLQNLVKSGIVHRQTAKEFEAEVVSKGPKEGEPLGAIAAFLPFNRNEATNIGAQVLMRKKGSHRSDWAPRSADELREDLLDGSLIAARNVAGKRLDKKRVKARCEEVLARDPAVWERLKNICQIRSGNRWRKQVGRREYGKTESNQGMSERGVPELAVDPFPPGPETTIELKELRHPKREVVLSPEQLDRNAEFRQLMEELGETNQTRLGKLLGCSPNHISGVLAAKVPASRRLVNDLRDLVKPQQPDSQIFKCLAEEVDPAVKAVLSKILREVQSIEGKHRLREAERVLGYAEMIRKVSK